MSGIRVNEWLHNSGTGGIWQTSAGNVGIASSVPTAKLVVTGDTNVSGALTCGDLTATSFSGSQFSNRNLITNGEMRVAQRGASVTTGTGNFATYTLDQWKIATYATDQLNLTVTQEAMNQAVPGFAYFIKVSPNAAETALAADEYTNLRQVIEAQDLQRLKWGTSSAESLTLSFWVKSNTTGTAGITFNKHDATAYYITRTYTINAVDTWEKKSVTIPGLTASGIANDTGMGLNIYWFLSAGSDYTSTDSTSWVTTGDSKYAYGHAINLTDSTSDYLALTGVQLEVGETATSYEHCSYGDELLRCQRYYWRTLADNNIFFPGLGMADVDGNSVILNTQFPVTMRDAPSALEQTGTASDYKIRRSTTQTCSAVPTFQMATVDQVSTVFTKSSHGWGDGTTVRAMGGTSGAYLGWSAEL